MQNFQVQFLQYSLAFYATRPAQRLLDFEDIYHFCSTLGPATVHLSISFSQPKLFVPFIWTQFHKYTKLGDTYNFVKIYLYAFKWRRTDLKPSVGKI